MATTSSEERPNMKQIDLTTLNLMELNHLKSSLEKELTIFQDSIATLKIAQQKYQNSNECIEKLTPECEGKMILVPLTGSMFVPGRLLDTKNVIIDIGTRFYAQKDMDEAKDYFSRKLAFVTEQMEKIHILGSEKNRICDTITECINMKKSQLAK